MPEAGHHEQTTRFWQVAWIAMFLIAIGLAFYPKVTGDRKYHWREGMELKGGVRLFYRVPDEAREELLDEVWQKQLELCRLRLEARVEKFYGLGPQVMVVGSDGVLVEVPGTRNIRKVLKEIGMARSVTIRGVISVDQERPEGDNVVSLGSGWVTLDQPAVTGSDIDFELLQIVEGDEPGLWNITLPLNEKGQEKFKELVRAYSQQHVAILLDNELVGLPQLKIDAENVAQWRMRPSDVRYGPFESVVDAETMRRILSSGPLPMSLELTEQQSAGPLFGDALRTSALRGILLGVALLLGFLALTYKARLRFWCVIIATSVFGCLLMIGAANLQWILISMTNAACIALLIGMNVDSQVITFEEIIRRFRRSEQLDESIRESLLPAFVVVVLGNLSTIAALAGLSLSEGMLREYFILTAIGIVINTVCFMFAYALTRDLSGQYGAWSVGSSSESFVREWIDRSSSLPEHRLFGPKSPVAQWMLIIPVLCFASWYTRGIPWGIEMSGGTELEVKLSQQGSEEAIHQSINEFFDDTCHVQQLSEDPPSYAIRTRKTMESEQATEALLSELEAKLSQEVELVRVRLFSRWRALSMTEDALVMAGAALAFLFSLFVLVFRDPRPVMRVFGALVIDVSAVISSAILLGIPVSLPVVAAVITLVGYSVNDSVIVVLKIRQFVKESAATSLQYDASGPALGHRPTDEANLREALREVMSRVVITSVSTICPMIGLFVFGQGILRDYAGIMIVGLISGTLTSYFVVGCRSVEVGATGRYD